MTIREMQEGVIVGALATIAVVAIVAVAMTPKDNIAIAMALVAIASGATGALGGALHAPRIERVNHNGKGRESTPDPAARVSSGG